MIVYKNTFYYNINYLIMNSNKIIRLVDFYHSMGIDYLIDNINIKSLKNEYLAAKASENKENNNSLATNFAIKKNIKEQLPIKEIESKPKLDLDHIKTLEELKQKLLNFNDCLLKKTAINTVFGCGDHNSEIMLIGEAPGAEEDEKGEPFVGRSGKLLMKALESINLPRDKIFITNTIFWRPPGNRNPTIEEMQICYPFIKRMIEIINPKLIIIVGKVATTNLIKTDEPIGKMRGKWFNLKLGSNSYLSRVVFHPSYLLRNSTQKKSLWLDLLEIKDKIKSINTQT